MKILLLLIGLLICQETQAKTYEFSNGMRFDIEGYLGWKQIISEQEFATVESQPEIGLTTSLKVTDTINIFNQFKYGTNINNILVYNHIAYTPKLPFDDTIITFRAGKIWYDYGLYNLTKINPRTRQGVFQPQAIYWSIFDQFTTSGLGGAVDFTYKQLTATYMIDKSTIINSDKEAQSWTLQPLDNLITPWFGHQLANIGYEFPEARVRTKFWWQSLKQSVGIPNTYNRFNINGSQLGAGVEWKYKKFTSSIEGFCTKEGDKTWANFDNYYCAISPTLSYDITENFSTRINYNQYRTPILTNQQTPLYRQVQTYSKDLNLGFGFHKGPWVANIEGHYIQGARLVEYDDTFENPNGYKDFWVVGMNVAWFWD